MINEEYYEDYSNAGGYGFWCGKKCVDKKRMAGKAPKFGKKHKSAYAEEQAAIASAKIAAAAEAEQAGGSKAPLVIGGLLVVGIIVTVVIIKMKKK